MKKLLVIKSKLKHFFHYNEFINYYRKQNASEKINLQHIMELREAFEAADTDHGGALEKDEVIHFDSV
jgi:hypothetical protein